MQTLCYILKDASTERTVGCATTQMKGSKNDYATFTGAIPASGSWQPGKTNSVGLVLGIFFWHGSQNPRRKLLVC
ncbi:hypothetical protein ACP0HM_18250 [Escherichia coli]